MWKLTIFYPAPQPPFLIQPTAYHDQATAMNWDLKVIWGRGGWVNGSDIIRVGLANRN